eukprot:ctg_334.g184
MTATLTSYSTASQSGGGRVVRRDWPVLVRGSQRAAETETPENAHTVLRVTRFAPRVTHTPTTLRVHARDRLANQFPMSPTGTLPTGSTVEKWLQTLPPSQPTVLFLFASEPESGRRASEAVYAALRACQSAYAQLRCVSLDVATDSDASGPTVATLLRAYAVESAPTVLYFASGHREAGASARSHRAAAGVASGDVVYERHPGDASLRFQQADGAAADAGDAVADGQPGHF